MKINEYSILGASALTLYSKTRQELHCKSLKNCSTDIELPELYPPQQLTNTEGLFEFIPKKKLRRIDRFSRLSLYASCLALEESGLWGEDLSRIGIAMASNFGAATTTFKFLDSFLESGDKLASPTHFSSSLHNAAPSYISLLSGIHGPSVTTSNSDIGFSYALLQAMQWLDMGLVEYALVGGVEEYNPVLDHCLTRLSTDGQAQYCGEGAAFIVLSNKAQGLCSVKTPTFSYFKDSALHPTGKSFIAPQHTPIPHKNCHSLTPLTGIHPSALSLCLACAVEHTALTKQTCSALAHNSHGTSSMLQTRI